MSISRRTPMAWIVPAVVLLVAGYPASTAAAAEDGPAMPVQIAQATDDGEKTCLKCHDEPPATLILHTRHAQKGDPNTPFANQQCETCHGRSEAHLVKPAEGQKRAPADIVFGPKSPTPAEKQNAVCMDCHEGGLRMNWAMSNHNAADMSCATCHDSHALQDPVTVKAEQTEVCFGCHVEQRVQSRKRSRHPMREGKVVCSDCHNPHGSFGPTQLVKFTVNETCYQCHAEKRGPFLWEHAPVTDDCSSCHNPHGSAQPRLLNVRTPWLCQMCHSETFHPSDVYSGTGLPPPAGGAGSRLLAKGCMNCHPKVHGTNHPSGPRLTR